MAINERTLRRRASLDARIQSRPEMGSLGRQLRDRKRQYGAEQRTNANTGRDLARYAEAQVPKIQGEYAQAGQRQQAAQGFANQVAPTAIGPASALQAAIIAESQRAGQNLAANEAAAVSGAHTDARRAKEGAAFATEAARGRYLDDADKIFELMREAIDQSTDIETKAFGDYLDAAIDDQRADSSAAETRRHNLATEEDAGLNREAQAKDKKKPTKGLGSLNGKEEQKVLDDLNVDEAREWIRRMSSGADDTQIRSTLTSGKKLSTGDTVPKFNKDAINIAFDLERNGYVSKPNINALHKRGVHVPPKWLGKTKKKTTRDPKGNANTRVTHGRP